MRRTLAFNSAAVFALLMLLSLTALIAPVRAFTEPDDIAECRRRDIVYGCDCDCNDPITNRVCGESTNGRCTLALASSGSSSDVSNFLGVNPFPTIGNSGGVLIVDADGNILIGPTAANIFKWIFWILAGAAVLLGLYGGFLYTTAGAEDDQVEKAQSVLKNALIGFVIALAGLLIVVILSNILKFNESGTGIDDAVSNDKTTTENERDRQEERDFFEDLFK